MQIGLYTDSVGKLSFEDALDFAVNIGIQTLEIATGGQSRAPHLRLSELLEHEDARQRWVDAIRSRGLVLESLNCSAFPLHPRLGIEHQKLIRDTIRLAEMLGVDSIVSQSGCPGDSDNARLPHWIVYRWPAEYLEVLEWQWDKAIALWRDLGAFALDHGVRKICFELHPLNLAYNVPTLLRLREAVGPHLGANLDPSHLMWQGMDIPACIKALGPAVLHTHIKDTRIEPQVVALTGVLDTTKPRSIADKPWAFRTIGHGHDALWWHGFVDALRTIGYSGPLSIENEDELLPGQEGVRRAATFLKDLL
ncbi:MAG TPA: sugar phosphate isomerase/epimerase [Chloroflexota bacterium]